MNLFDCLQSFIEVAENKGFSKAARKRFRTTSAVSKQILWLEGNLGVQLFVRSTRQVSLTEAGELLYQKAQLMLLNLDEIKKELQSKQQEASGRLTVTLPVVLAQAKYSNEFSKFLKKYPKIQLDLRINNRFCDLHAEGIDVAIRTASPLNKIYHCEPLMETQRSVFASPAFLKKHGTPTTIAELENLDCLLHTEMTNPNQWQMANNRVANVKGRLLCNSTKTLINAAVNGLGCFYSSSYSVTKELKSKKLVPILTKLSPPPSQIVICYPKLDFIPLKTKVFVDFLRHKELKP